jgi:hypothetical protein
MNINLFLFFKLIYRLIDFLFKKNYKIMNKKIFLLLVKKSKLIINKL